MTINNKSERNYRDKCLGWPVTSYGAVYKTKTILPLLPQYSSTKWGEGRSFDGDAYFKFWPIGETFIQRRR